MHKKIVTNTRKRKYTLNIELVDEYIGDNVYSTIKIGVATKIILRCCKDVGIYGKDESMIKFDTNYLSSNIKFYLYCTDSELDELANLLFDFSTYFYISSFEHGWKK